MKEIEERGRRWRENICERKKKTRRNELEYVGYQVDIIYLLLDTDHLSYIDSFLHFGPKSRQGLTR